MQVYKRNQVEEAIARTIEGLSEPSAELQIRLKRLLDLDRKLGRTVRSSDPERVNFAFFSEDQPGKGVEVSFSDYDAFALLTGLRILQHGWPQSFAVEALRQVRSELEAQHTRILKQDPKELFDFEEIQRRARSGAPFFDNADPVFLVIVTAQSRSKQAAPPSKAICRGDTEAAKFVKGVGAHSYTMFELATLAHRLASELSKTEPRKRGRS